MNLTEERAELLVNYLGEDTDRTENLLQMTPEEAVEAINADGYDFTPEELKEFCETVQKTVALRNSGGELDDEALDSVSGGGFRLYIDFLGKYHWEHYFEW